MGRLQIDPQMAALLEQRRRRAMDEDQAGPEQLRFMDQGAGMMPQSAPADFPMDPMQPTMPTNRAALMGMQPPQALNPAPAPDAAPLLPPPPNGQIGALGANPYLSSIVTGSGTRTMAYPTLEGGGYGRGVDQGMVPFEGPQNPADGLRSSFMRNLYGNGTPSTFLPPELAARMAMGEMQNRTVQSEGDLQRQNLLEREKLEQTGRVSAAGMAHKNNMGAGLQTLLMNAGLSGQADEAERLALRFGLIQPNPNSPPVSQQPASGVGYDPKAMRGLLPLMPNTVAMPSRAGGKDVMLPGGLDKATPATNMEFMNRLAGMNLDQAGMDKQVQQLRDLPNGEAFLDNLIKQGLSERIAYEVDDQLPRDPITGSRKLTPSTINFDDLEGVQANANNGFWETMRSSVRGRLPNYRATLPGGRTIDLPVSSMPKSRTALGQTDVASKILSQPEFRSKFLRSALRLSGMEKPQ